MPPAIPAGIGAGLSLFSAIKGAGQQGRANKINSAQLQQLQMQQAQQNQIRQAALGKLLNQPTGNAANPFSSSYGPLVGPH